MEMENIDLREELNEDPSSNFMEEPHLACIPADVETKMNVQEGNAEVLKVSVESEVQETESNCEQLLYKPRHLDTETLIKEEIKQFILTEVSEATSAKTLNDMAFDVGNQITTLKENISQLLNNNKSLDQEVEIDKNRLRQSENILLHTNEINELLNQNMEDLENQFKVFKIHEILEKSKKQYNDLKLLKDSFESKFKIEEEKINKLLTLDNEHNKILNVELKHQEETLEDLRKKYNEMKKIISSYEEEIAKQISRKRSLEENLKSIKNKHISEVSHSGINPYENLLCKLDLKKANQIEKLANANQRKVELEQQLRECIDGINSLNNSISDIKEETVQKTTHLEQLVEQLGTSEKHHDTLIQQIKSEVDSVACRLQQIQSNIISLGEYNEKLHENLNTLKSEYISKCEDKLMVTQKMLEEQTVVHDLESILTKKQLENASNRANLEELQNQYTTLLESVKSKDNEKFEEQNKLSKKLADLSTKYELLKTENDKYIHEMTKKKEYIAETSNYLEEKSVRLQQEVDKTEIIHQNLIEENVSHKLAIDKKQIYLNEINNKLEALKKKNNTAHTSEFKPAVRENVKKVQFKEFPSYKSATDSSQNSSQAAPGSGSKLERSFQEWLEFPD